MADEEDDELRRLAARFDQDARDGFARLARDVGYRPTRYRELVARLGGVAAAKQVLRSPGATGLETLWRHRRLDVSVEACVLRPAYAQLFDDEDRELARRRLEQLEFDVDAYLRGLDRGG